MPLSRHALTLYALFGGLACGRSELALSRALGQGGTTATASGGVVTTGSGGAGAAGGRVTMSSGGIAVVGIGGTLAGGVAGAGGSSGDARGGSASGGRLGCGPLIDDMEDRSGRICAGEGRLGVWYAFNDDSGQQWPQKTTPGVPIPVSALVDARPGSAYAVHTYGTGFLQWGAGVGFDLSFDGQAYRRYDASAYSGISFWARAPYGQQLRFRVGSTSTTAMQYGGTCQNNCPGPAGAMVAVGPEWKQVKVSFQELITTGGLRGDELNALINVQFMWRPAFDFWIDDVAFTTEDWQCCAKQPACSDGVVHFASPALAQATNSYSAGDALDCREACAARSLSVNGQDVRDLGGVECLSTLNQLFAAGSGLASLAPLSGLSELVAVEVSHNRITNLTPLARLTWVSTLSAGDNMISDLEPLAHSGSLQSLSLSTNQIQNIDALASLPLLASVDLSSNQIMDARPLSGHAELSSLRLNDNALSRLDDLANLPKLGVLELKDNSIVSGPPARGLTALDSLLLANNRVTDLSMLSELSTLTVLDLSHNSVSALDPLSRLPALKALDLSYNQIVDVAALAELAELQSLNLASNRVADPSALGSLASLGFLSLSNNEISDGTLVSSLRALTLDLSGNHLESIAYPRWAATSIDLSHNGLSVLAGLSGDGVTLLNLAENQLTDLSGIEGVSFANIPCGGRCSGTSGLLDLSGNPVTDLTPLLQLSMPVGFRVTLQRIDAPCSAQAPVLEALRAKQVNVTSDCE